MITAAPAGRRRAAIVAGLAALGAAALLAAGCGSSGDGAASTGGDAGGQATVLAASSLTEVLPRIDPGARFSFGGSDQLAFQLEQGAPADVLASASPRYTQALFAKGVVGTPRAFATNRLVMIVPRGAGGRITSLAQVTDPGVKLVIGAPGVPVGDYARTALARLGLGAALGNVVSEEPDVKGVVAKVAYGEADAGFAYATDARAARDRVQAIAVPASAAPQARYEVAVATRAPHPGAAQAFVDRLTSADGRRQLRQAGFGVPGR